MAVDPQEGRHGNKEQEGDGDKKGLGSRLWNRFLEERSVRELMVFLLHSSSQSFAHCAMDTIDDEFHQPTRSLHCDCHVNLATVL